MTTLAQIIALEKGIKSRSESAVTAVYHGVQKEEPLSGLSRKYEPKDDAGDRLPDESTQVQVSAAKLLEKASGAWVDLLDIVATKDFSNCGAKANVVVDGVTLIENAPPPFLIFVEKKCADIRSVLDKMPTLKPSETWRYDPAQDVFATPPIQSTKTKKVFRNHVKAEATKEHAAQVEVYTEDEIVGMWTTVKFSGALETARLNLLKERLVKLQEAVIRAREEANSTAVSDVSVGKKVMDYLFAD